MHGGGVGGERVLGGVVATAELAGETLRLRSVLIRDVSLEVVLIADEFLTEGADAGRTTAGAAAGEGVATAAMTCNTTHDLSQRRHYEAHGTIHSTSHNIYRQQEDLKTTSLPVTVWNDNK